MMLVASADTFDRFSRNTIRYGSKVAILCVCFVQTILAVEKIKNMNLDSIGDENIEFCAGSICRPKIEQFQGKSCRNRIQMNLEKCWLRTILLVTCICVGNTRLASTNKNLPCHEIRRFVAQINPNRMNGLQIMEIVTFLLSDRCLNHTLRSPTIE